MIRDSYNVIPVTMAAALHAALVSSMIFVFDLSGPAHPVVPLAITARIVTEEEIRQPPPAEPEPEPEPVPDPAEEQRQLEEQKRLEDQRIEQDRIRREEEAERQRQEQAAEERRNREEAEIERRRQEAERRRLEEVERQRAENERLRREAEEAELQRRRQQEIDDEETRLAAMNAGLKERYMFLIKQQIYRNWAPPLSAKSGSECEVEVRQVRGGVVGSVNIVRCDPDDDALRRSIEAAVFGASPLPDPPDPSVFDRNLRLILKTEQ